MQSLKNKVKAAISAKCATKTTAQLIESYTLVRMRKNLETHELATMVALGDIIEDRIGEDAFDEVMIEIDDLKFAKAA